MDVKSAEKKVPTYKILERFPMLTSRQLAQWRKARINGNLKLPAFYQFTCLQNGNAYYDMDEFEEFMESYFTKT